MKRSCKEAAQSRCYLVFNQFWIENEMNLIWRSWPLCNVFALAYMNSCTYVIIFKKICIMVVFQNANPIEQHAFVKKRTIIINVFAMCWCRQHPHTHKKYNYNLYIKPNRDLAWPSQRHDFGTLQITYTQRDLSILV